MGCHWFRLLLAISGLLPLAAASEEDDAYLQALEAEAARIEAPEMSETEPAETGGERKDRAGFEAELKKHQGTYSFYRALLEKDKAEVYKAYREGADFARIRKMIISRRLHR